MGQKKMDALFSAAATIDVEDGPPIAEVLEVAQRREAGGGRQGAVAGSTSPQPSMQTCPRACQLAVPFTRSSRLEGSS
jgi:hypothetical protein